MKQRKKLTRNPIGKNLSNTMNPFFSEALAFGVIVFACIGVVIGSIIVQNQVNKLTQENLSLRMQLEELKRQ